MNNKLGLFALAVGALALIGVSLLLFKPAPEAPTPGATSGPDRFNQCESRNGVIQCFYHGGLTQASTTLCNIKSPTASSTLVWADLRVVGSTTSMLIDFGRSSSPDATTTAIGTSYNVVAGKYAEIQASTSPAAAASTIFQPNTWLVIKAGLSTGGAFGTFSQTGACNATFEVI